MASSSVKLALHKPGAAQLQYKTGIQSGSVLYNYSLNLVRDLNDTLHCLLSRSKTRHVDLYLDSCNVPKSSLADAVAVCCAERQCHEAFSVAVSPTTGADRTKLRVSACSGFRGWGFGREDGHGIHSLPRNECPVCLHASPGFVNSGATKSVFAATLQIVYLCRQSPVSFRYNTSSLLHTRHILSYNTLSYQTATRGIISHPELLSLK